MKNRIDKKSAASLVFLSLGGFAAGFTNGFLASGGGIILYILLSRLNPDRSPSAARDNFASVVAAVLPLCIVSAITYSAKGNADLTLLSRFAIPAVIGGVLGAFICDKVKGDTLKFIFSVILIVSGINIIIR